MHKKQLREIDLNLSLLRPVSYMKNSQEQVRAYQQRHDVLTVGLSIHGRHDPNLARILSLHQTADG